jgi:hypothetical protein
MFTPEKPLNVYGLSKQISLLINWVVLKGLPILRFALASMSTPEIPISLHGLPKQISLLINSVVLK